MTPNVELVGKFSQILLKKLIIFPNKSSLQRRILIFGEKSSLFHVNDLCDSYDKRIYSFIKHSVTIWGVMSKNAATLTSLISPKIKMRRCKDDLFGKNYKNNQLLQQNLRKFFQRVQRFESFCDENVKIG